MNTFHKRTQLYLMPSNNHIYYNFGKCRQLLIVVFTAASRNKMRLRMKKVICGKTVKNSHKLLNSTWF